MSRSPGTEGFTLAEVMVSVFLLAVALLGLMTAVTYATRARALSQERLRASASALTLMTAIEEVLTADYAQFAASHRHDQVPLEEPAGYLYSLEDRLESSTLKRVVISVYYPESGNGAIHEYRLETLLHRWPD